jgi:hypothetical protein
MFEMKASAEPTTRPVPSNVGLEWWTIEMPSAQLPISETQAGHPPCGCLYALVAGISATRNL